MIALSAIVTLFALQTWRQAMPEVSTPHVLAQFSTQLAADEHSRNANVQIAARRISGTVLLPGQAFSFNKTVGPRTPEGGYRDAPTFTPLGKLDSLAGGICQLSSTLYNSALLANLRIVERHPHSLTVRYLTPGRDATVSEYADLRFQNNLDGPIRIVLDLHGRDLRCTIMGARTREERVVIEVEKRRLPTGLIATRTIRSVLKDDQLLSREVVSEDTYIPSR